MRSLADIYINLADQQGPLSNVFSSGKLQTLWRQVASKEIQRHTEPEKIIGKKLVIATDSPIWAQELNFLKSKFIEKLKALNCGTAIETIEFKVGHPEKKDKQRAGEEEKVSRCKQCGILYRGAGQKCFFCDKIEKDEKKGAIYKLIRQSPWKNYAEAKPELEGIESQDFRRAKQEIVARLKDDLYYISRHKQDFQQERMQQMAYMLAMHRSGFRQSKITSAMLKKYLNPKVYEAIFETDKNNKKKR